MATFCHICIAGQGNAGIQTKAAPTPPAYQHSSLALRSPQPFPRTISGLAENMSRLFSARTELQSAKMSPSNAAQLHHASQLTRRPEACYRLHLT
mmetsp:Transcript_36961/g.73150  ORF Transcript_36961/g.73150 Transcript_36961/m.73150 type:complete len:95 (+) Transcript_36961:1477-1761(+)